MRQEERLKERNQMNHNHKSWRLTENKNEMTELQSVRERWELEQEMTKYWGN